MAFAMTGKTGALRVGGRPALTLDTWSLTTREQADGGGWRLEGHASAKDDYWLERAAAFDLRLDLTKSVWRWRGVPAAALLVDGDAVTITHEGEPEDA
jgi:hypothetical protein